MDVRFGLPIARIGPTKIRQVLTLSSRQMAFYRRELVGRQGDDTDGRLIHSGSMFDPTHPIPWDHPVEIFEAMPSLRVKTIAMTLRQAVEVFRDTPEDGRWSLGVGLQKLAELHMKSWSVAVGFLNASALAELVELLPQL